MTEANSVEVHVPVRSFVPLNVAIGVVAIDTATSTAVATSSDVPFWEHPMTFGIVTLALAHCRTLNARAARSKVSILFMGHPLMVFILC